MTYRKAPLLWASPNLKLKKTGNEEEVSTTMSYPGFGRESGPNQGRPNALPSFGLSPLQQPQRGPSPAVSNSVPNPYVSPPKRPEAVERMQSPLLSSDRSLPAFTSSSDPRPQEPFPRRPMYQDFGNKINQLPSATTLLVASRGHGSSITAKVTRHEDLKGVNFPVHYAEKDLLQNTSERVVNHSVSRARSPLSYEDVYDTNDNSSLEEPQSYPGVQIGKHNGIVSQTPRLPHATLENFYSAEEVASLQQMKRSVNSGGNPPVGDVDNGTRKPNILLLLAHMNNVYQGSQENSENNQER